MTLFAARTRRSVLLALAVASAPSLPLAARAEDRDKERREEELRDHKSEEKPASQDDLLYALGALLGHRIANHAFTAREMELVRKGFADAAMNRKLRLPDPDLDEWGPRVDEMMSRRSKPLVTAVKDQGKAFAEAAAKEPGALQLPSGAVIRTLAPGTGRSPLRTSRVKVSYVGKLIDGTVFDSSQSHGGPAQFALDQVISCWTEAVPKMRQGEKARLVCPSSVAYGDQGRPPQIPPGATLVFEIELVAVD